MILIVPFKQSINYLFWKQHFHGKQVMCEGRSRREREKEKENLEVRRSNQSNCEPTLNETFRTTLEITMHVVESCS